jgi:hypothetical protein
LVPILTGLFIAALLLVWYENKFTVLGVERRPLVLSRPLWVVALFVTRLLLTYGAMIAVGFVFGFIAGVVEFLIYWVFSSVTAHYYFSREVRRLAAVLSEPESPVEQDQESFAENADVIVRYAEALKDAKKIVTENIKTAGRGSAF